MKGLVVIYGTIKSNYLIKKLTICELNLTKNHFLFQGGRKKVYQHPHNRNMLVKILYLPNHAAWHNKIAFKQKKLFLREMHTFLKFHKRYKNYNILEEIYGFANTNLGKGMLVKAYKDKNNKIAPTLEEIIRNKNFTKEMVYDLEEFFKECYYLKAPLKDINPCNMVYAYCPKHKKNKFFLVDGIGDTRWLTIAPNLHFPNKLLLYIKQMEYFINQHTDYNFNSESFSSSI